MTLTKFNENVIPSFSSLFDDFFNTRHHRKHGATGLKMQGTPPKVNIAEDNDQFILEMAAPGLQKKDFSLQVDENVMTVGYKKSDKNEYSKYANLEFAYQEYSRSFTLPELVNKENIKAAYKDGILLVSIPKLEKAKEKAARKILVG